MELSKILEIVELLDATVKDLEFQACGVDSYSLQDNAIECMSNAIQVGFEGDMTEDQARKIILAFNIPYYLKREQNGEDAVARIREEFFLDQ